MVTEEPANARVPDATACFDMNPVWFSGEGLEPQRAAVKQWIAGGDEALVLPV